MADETQPTGETQVVETQPAEGTQPEKPKRGRPFDPEAPLKPKNAFQKCTAEARARIKEENPAIAQDLKAMAMALKEAWDAVPQAEKDRLGAIYEDEMAIYRPKFEAYKETDSYKKFFEVKQDWVDIKQRKILAKKHVKAKFEVGTKVRAAGKFTHEFPTDESKNYDIVAGQKGTIEALKIDEEKNATVNWEGLGPRTYLRKYFGKLEDPDIPKRPKSGYMIFAGDVRAQCQAEVEAAGGGLADVGKKVAEKWIALTEAQKAKYGEQAQQQKEKFDGLFSVYKDTDKFKDFQNKKVNLISKQQLGKVSRVTHQDAPKRVPSDRMLFKKEMMDTIVEELKAEGKAQGRDEVGAKVKAKWEALTEEEQADWKKRQLAMKKEYEGSTKSFKKKIQYLRFIEERQKIKIRQNRQVNLRDMPKKPKSVFAMYAQEHKAEVPSGKGEGKGVNALKTKFQEATEEEKAALAEKQKELLKDWAGQVEEFKTGDSWKTFQNTDKRVKREFMTEAMKVLTLRFLDAAPPQPPKSSFSIYVSEKRKAKGEPIEAPDPKAAKKDTSMEVAAYKTEFSKLDKDMKNEYDEKLKECTTAWKAEVADFMVQDTWKEYLVEAKRLRVPIRSLLQNKNQSMKNIGSGRQIALPSKPDTMPNKPGSAFRNFAKEKKRTETADLDKIAELWKALDEEERKRWEEEATAQLKQFEQDMRDFKKSEEGRTYIRTRDTAVRMKRNKHAKDTYLKEQPKAPPTALQMFFERESKPLKKEKPELKGHEVQKILRERWVAFTEEEKAPILEIADKRYKEYETKIAEFKESDNWKKYVKLTATKAKGKAKGKAGGSSIKKPASYPQKGLTAPFKVYAAENAEMDPAACLEGWKGLSEEEKSTYGDKVRELERSYNEEVAAWNSTPEGKKYLRDVSMQSKRKRLNDARAKFLQDQPKRPPSAYNLFTLDKRQEILQRTPDIKASALQTELVQAFKDLDEEEKQVWHDKEKELLEEFKRQEDEFQSSKAYKSFKAIERNVTGAGKGRGEKATKLPPAPKAPENLPKKPVQAAAVLYKQDNPTGNFAELDDEGKAEWEGKIKELNSEYEREMDAFKATPEGKKFLRLEKAHEQRVKEIRTKQRITVPEAPKRPASAYFLFIADKRPTLSGSIGEVAKQMSTMWTNIEKEEKEIYDKKAADSKALWDEQMAEYNKNPQVLRLKKEMSKLKQKPGKSTSVKGGGRGGGRGRGGGDKSSSSSSDSDAMGSDSSSSDSDSD